MNKLVVVAALSALVVGAFAGPDKEGSQQASYLGMPSSASPAAAKGGIPVLVIRQSASTSSSTGSTSSTSTTSTTSTSSPSSGSSSAGSSGSGSGSGSGASSQKPDFFWGFLSWDAFKPYQSQVAPISSLSEGQTQQLTQQILDTFPYLQSLYEQYNQMGNQITGYLNPQQFMGQMQSMLGGAGGGSGGGGNSGGSSSGSSNPFASMLGRR